MNHLTVQWSGHDSHSGSSLVIHLTVCCPFSLALMSDANDDDDVSLSRAVYVEPKPKVHPKPSCALERTPERTPELSSAQTCCQLRAWHYGTPWLPKDSQTMHKHYVNIYRMLTTHLTLRSLQ